MTDFRIDNSLGFIIYQTNTKLRQELQRQFSSHGHIITLPQWFILNRLWEEEGLTQNDLAERTFRDKTTTARTIALLEAQQLLFRERDPSDRRNYLISLTPAGRALKGQLIPLAVAVLDKACQGLSDKQVTAAREMLNTICANLEPER